MKFKKLLVVIVGLAVLLVGCGNNNSQSGSTPTGSASSQAPDAVKPTSIRVGLVCGGLNQTFVTVGLADGTFEKAGLNIEKVCFESGADSVQALIGGSLDVNFGSYEHVLRQRSNSLDVKAYGNFNNTIGYHLLVKKDSPIQSASELKGKVIGVTKTGTLSDSGLRMILEQENIDPQRGVEIVSAGSGATMLAALEGGKVDAGMITEPNVSQMVASGDYRILVDPTFDYVGLVAMAKPDWVAANSEAMSKFLGALKDLRNRVEADPATAGAAIKSSFEQIPADVLEQAITRWVSGIPADLIITEEGAEAVVASQVELGTISKSVPFEDTVDLSFIP